MISGHTLTGLSADRPCYWCVALIGEQHYFELRGLALSGLWLVAAALNAGNLVHRLLLSNLGMRILPKTVKVLLLRINRATGPAMRPAPLSPTALLTQSHRPAQPARTARPL